MKPLDIKIDTDYQDSGKREIRRVVKIIPRTGHTDDMRVQYVVLSTYDPRRHGLETTVTLKSFSRWAAAEASGEHYEKYVRDTNWKRRDSNLKHSRNSVVQPWVDDLAPEMQVVLFDCLRPCDGIAVRPEDQHLRNIGHFFRFLVLRVKRRYMYPYGGCPSLPISNSPDHFEAIGVLAHLPLGYIQSIVMGLTVVTLYHPEDQARQRAENMLDDLSRYLHLEPVKDKAAFREMVRRTLKSLEMEMPEGDED